MPRTHFYHTVLRQNPTSGDIEPLENIEAIPYPVSALGVESGIEAAYYAGRTGATIGNNISGPEGVVQFYLESGDYNVHMEETESPARITNFAVGVNGASGTVQNTIDGEVNALQTLTSGHTSTIATAASDISDLQTAVSGLETDLDALDANNFVASLRQKLSLSDSPAAGIKRRGKSIIFGEGTRTNTAYGALTGTAPGPDVVPDVEVTDDAVIIVLYAGLVKTSVVHPTNNKVAIFIDSNQLKTHKAGNLPTVQEAVFGVTHDQYVPFTTAPFGLVAMATDSVPHDEVNTGMAYVATEGGHGGPCYIFGLPAGFYDISVQYKAHTAGTITAKRRKLIVWTMTP